MFKKYKTKEDNNKSNNSEDVWIICKIYDKQMREVERGNRNKECIGDKRRKYTSTNFRT